MRNTTRSILFGITLLSAAWASATLVTNATVHGTLATSAGASIRDDDLARWIDTYIPTNTPKLLVLTQCYGGDTAKAFTGKTNTVVLSATSAGQKAVYGGYDAGAANAMRPGSGRTAGNIHTAGAANRDTIETPIVGGGMNPTNFPMTSVSTSGVVRSRHVIWYAGQPDGRPGRDVDQDALLQGHYAGETNTTYWAVAASTDGGWDYDGSARGLRQAIQAAGTLITNSTDPDAEQFVLYVSDHGDRHVTASLVTNLPPNQLAVLTGFPTFSSLDMNPQDLLDDTNTVPGFSVFIPFEPGGPVFDPDSEPFFLPPDWGLTITITNQSSLPPLFLTNPIELPLELDNGTVGDFPGEGVQLFFPVEPQFFVDSFFDVFVTIEVVQDTGLTWPISHISQDSGEVPKDIAPTDGRRVELRPDVIDTEIVALGLHGIEGAVYPIETRTNLLSGEWEPLDTLLGEDTIPGGGGGRLAYPIPPSTTPTRFFRALFPQPTLAGVEPALRPEGEDVPFIFLTGSGFYPGDTVLVGGQPSPHVEFDAHGLLRVDLPPGLPPGRYDVTVVDHIGGTVLATLADAIEIFDPLADPLRALASPPAWPPAGPAPALSRHYGHVTVLKSHGGDEDCDGTDDGILAYGHITVLKRGGNEQGSGMPSGRRYIGTEECDDGVGSTRDRSAAFSRQTDYDLNRDGEDRLDDDSEGDSILELRLHAGEIEQRVVDLAVPGRGLDFVWARTYRSRTGIATPQGNRWSHSYDVYCVTNGTTVDVHDGTGRKDTFRRQANGTYTCPEFFREGTLTTNVFRLTFADTGYWEFNPFDAASPASGKLARIVDRNANIMSLDYDGSGQLTELVDDLGRTNTVAYNPAGQIASVSDFSGRTVTYTYCIAGDPDGLPGDLKSVTSPPVTGTSTSNDFPIGKTTAYTYSTNAAPGASGLLLAITDPLGQTPIQCTYDIAPSSFSAWRAISLQRGTNLPTRVVYLSQKPSPNNRFATLQCMVNDPEGNVSEQDFDSRNRCVALRDFTGRAQPGQPVTTTENRPVGKLRPGDPDFFESTWRWNNDSLCTAWQRPMTNRIEWVYQADLAPTTPPRHRGNLLTERRVGNGDFNHDGFPDLLVSSFEHDPRFGTGEHGMLLFEDQWPESGDFDFNDVVLRHSTRVITPRGFEARCEYDANGNLVARTRHGSDADGGSPPLLAREDFTYNAHGQLTAITNAADGAGYRRYDVYLYGESPGATNFGYQTQAIMDAGPVGRNVTTSYDYDARGNVTRCVDPRGTPTTIEVNALNQTVASQTEGTALAERVRTQYTYDAANNLVRKDVENRDGDGTLDSTNAWFTTQYEYDPLYRLTRLMEEEGIFYGSLTNEFVYDGNDRLVQLRSPLAVQGGDPSHVTHYQYDERDLLFRETRAPGSPVQATTQYDYDDNGNLCVLRSGLEGPAGARVAQYDYDGFDRCVRSTDPMGNEIRYEYDANRNCTNVTRYGETNDVPGSAGNQRLSETRYEYDALDRCVAVRDAFFDVYTQLPLGDGWRDTTFFYAPNGLIVATTNDRGFRTTYTFDTTLFMTGVADALSNRVDYIYDDNGNVLTATQTGRSDLGGPDEVFVRRYTYDALDRCVAEWDNVGNTNRYAYDSRDNRVRHTDPLGFSQESDFDGLSRPTSNRQGVGGSAQRSTHYTYDAASRLVTSTDSNTNVTQYAYDALDRLAITTLADNTSATNIYDVHSNLIQTHDANGTQILWAYDTLNRCVQKIVAPGPGVAPDTTFESYQYDGMSRMVRAANNQTEVTCQYDSLGRCVREGTASPALGLTPRECTRTFDAHGLLLVQTNYSGRLAGYSYDPLDRTASLSKADAGKALNPVAAFAYTGPDRLARVTFTNGVQTDYTYSGLDSVTNAPGDSGWGQIQRVHHALGAVAIDDRLFTYDRSQNKAVRALTEPFVLGGTTNRQVFVYDSLNRLVQSVISTNGTIAHDTAYLLDAVGNRLSVVRDGTNQPYTLDARLPIPADFQVHQYTDTPFDARQYDENGNLHQTVSGDPISPETRTFTYDYADRLVAVQGSSGPVATYAYDALGRRIAKVVFAGLPPMPVITNRYLFAGGELIEEEDGGGAVVRTTVRMHVVDHDGRSSITSSGDVLFHHCDDQGSLLALTDEAGVVIERFDYDDYGTPQFLDDKGAPRPGATAPLSGVRELFHGMTWNEETGLYGGGDDPLPHMNKGELVDAIAKDAKAGYSRYFDPSIGRALSRADVGNNPWSTGGGKTQDYNSSRSNKSCSRADVGPGGAKTQDYNSSRSNKSSSRFDPGGGGNGSDGLKTEGSLKKGNSVQLIGSGRFSISARAARSGRRSARTFVYTDCFPTRYVYPSLDAASGGTLARPHYYGGGGSGGTIRMADKFKAGAALSKTVK
ncbi:MAG: hypothetical protein HQ523_02355 [Lentisphaerae bacterium]|nr:hypothetical protein [Lentisphaerota bacterium]